MNAPESIPQPTTALRRLATLAGMVGLITLACARPAWAHDFWIEPSRFTPLVGQPVSARLLVGEHFSGDPVGRPAPQNMHRMVLVDSASGDSVTLPGRPGADPAGLFRPVRPGAYIIGFHGKPIAIELPAEKFNPYLKDEGLDAVIAARAERGQTDAPGREMYSRCAKSLIQAGQVGADTGADTQPFDRALGFTLELVADSRPVRSADGATLPAQLLLEGKPLAGALVIALLRSEPNRRIEQRSDADGRVRLPLSGAGQWLVKAVHMRPAPADSGADWESLWASLTFAVGDAD